MEHHISKSAGLLQYISLRSLALGIALLFIASTWALAPIPRTLPDPCTPGWLPDGLNLKHRAG